MRLQRFSPIVRSRTRPGTAVWRGFAIGVVTASVAAALGLAGWCQPAFADGHASDQNFRSVAPPSVRLLAQQADPVAKQREQDLLLERKRKAFSRPVERRRGDSASVAKIWRRLAEKGDAKAQNQLGIMYENGEGVRQSFVEAAKWYRLAAEQGHTGAQLWLGNMYRTQDYVQAHMWFSLAAAYPPVDVPDDLPDAETNRFWSRPSLLDLTAQERMAVIARENVEQLMTPKQIAEAQRLAREWNPK